MAIRNSKDLPPPSIVRGRKGGMSIADALVAALWNPTPNSHDWPERTIEELRIDASRRLGYEIPNSTIRSALYTTTDTFERCSAQSLRAVYRLTKRIKVMKTSHGKR